MSRIIPSDHKKILINAWKKDDIINWLLSKGVHIDTQSMIKGQLLVKVNEIKHKYLSYVIDNIAKDAGHKILRLPPYHCEFNPIELA